MLDALGKIIEKKPWLVITLTIIITLVFASFIPSLEFKTNFKDFAPDNEYVRANNRISEYFGMNKQILFLIVEKQQTESILSSQALRDQYVLMQKLKLSPYINSSIGIPFFIDTICQMEFNTTLENCSDSQIQTAVFDLFQKYSNREYQLFESHEQNVDHQSLGGLQKTWNDAVNIQNCYIQETNETFSFSFQVRSLDEFPSPVKPVIPRTYFMEWFLGFENSLLPPEYAMKYQITVRIEPAHHSWQIGDGFISNLRQYLLLKRSHTLKQYTFSPYLWLTPPGQSIAFPVLLQSARIHLEKASNRIVLTVNRSELSNFGIPPTFGSFILPAKLTNFSAGVRYYQTPVLHRPGTRVVLNTSVIFNQLASLSQKPLRSALLSRFLEKNGMSLDDLTQMLQSSAPVFPKAVSFKDIHRLWTPAYRLPSEGVSSTVVPLIPPFFDDLRVNALSFISKDFAETKKPRASLIIVYLDAPSSDSETIAQMNSEILRYLRTLDDQFNSISLQATGEGLVSSEINTVAMQSNGIIGPSIFIIIVCILFLAFRKPSYVVLPIVVFAFSCIWLFGTMALLGISFSIIAVALLPLNIGLGVEYSVNILHNYRVELGRGRTPHEAIRLSIKEVGLAIVLAWFTTFVAFLSFLTATLPPIRDFGIFLALGITYTFVITMTFMTAVRFLLDRNKTISPKNHRTSIFSMKNSLGRLAKILLRYDKIVFLVTIVLCISMVTAVSQLKTGFSINQFVPKDTPALQRFEQISADFPFSSQDQEYVLLEGNIASVDVLKGLSVIHANMENDRFVARKSDGRAKTESIYTVVRQAVINNQSLISEFHIDEKTGIPRTNDDVYRLYTYLYSDVEYSSLVRPVLYQNNSTFSAAIIRVYTDLQSNTTDMTTDFEVLKSELYDDLVSIKDITISVTGNLLITLTIMKNMTESQILSTGVCFIFAALILSVLFRNPLLGLIAMIPVTMSIVWVLGTMYFLGYTLNIMTIMVTSLTIGVGIDYACYITERFKLIADKTGDVSRAVVETISHTGNAIFIAALSSMFGFGILMFAPIPPQQQFGLVTAITLVYAFLTSILVLPLVLARWAKWRKNRKGYIIHPGQPKGLDGIRDDVEYPGEQ
ncbi:MAG: efflux RND transporter permease subunit [Candidatus Thermoplasmatota archaeon]